jgi:hypothetical protein
MSKTHPLNLVTLRSTVRAILLEHGTALAPTADTPEGIDDLIAEVVNRDAALRRDSDALLRRVEAASDRDIARVVSDHFGAIMAAYGDSGYHVGLAAGLELAALIAGQSVSSPVVRIRRGRKAAAR